MNKTNHKTLFIVFLTLFIIVFILCAVLGYSIFPKKHQIEKNVEKEMRKLAKGVKISKAELKKENHETGYIKDKVKGDEKEKKEKEWKIFALITILLRFRQLQVIQKTIQKKTFEKYVKIFDKCITKIIKMEFSDGTPKDNEGKEICEELCKIKHIYNDDDCKWQIFGLLMPIKINPDERIKKLEEVAKRRKAVTEEELEVLEMKTGGGSKNIKDLIDILEKIDYTKNIDIMDITDITDEKINKLKNWIQELKTMHWNHTMINQIFKIVVSTSR